MFTAYMGVTVLAAAANIWVAIVDFIPSIRPKWLAIKMDKAGVPQSWLFPLGALKAAGALGLLVGIGVPQIGVAAAVGLVLFFVGAIITQIRAHQYLDIFLSVPFFLLAVGALVLRLASS